jgi:hypothetical protein
MPRFKGRPNHDVTIADCASLCMPQNPTPLCPHGLLWWESDGDRLTDELQARMCREAGCEATEFHPHEGESITVRDEWTFNGRKPLRAAYIEGIAASSGLPMPDGFDDRLREAVQRSVIAWTWTGLHGEALPLPSEDWETVADHLEYSELLWILEAAIRGKDPREAYYRPPAQASGKDSPNG